MRTWDLHVSDLCDQHLLGEHRELHAIWSILTDENPEERGYYDHPETQRWIGKLNILYRRHSRQVEEMMRRGMNHDSPLDKVLIYGQDEEHRQEVHLDPPNEQVKMLRKRCEECRERIERRKET